jgi:hypothetical protein
MVDIDALTPRSTLRDLDRKSAIAVLTKNYNNIRQHLDNSAIRGVLVEQHALTLDDIDILLDAARASISEANERLIRMIQRGGVNGFRQFMIALQKTSASHQGHQDILECLMSDLKHIQPHSRSATCILDFLQNPSHRV